MNKRNLTYGNLVSIINERIKFESECDGENDFNSPIAVKIKEDIKKFKYTIAKRRNIGMNDFDNDTFMDCQYLEKIDMEDMSQLLKDQFSKSLFLDFISKIDGNG